MPQKTSIFLSPLGRQHLSLFYETPPALRHPGEKAEPSAQHTRALWEWARPALSAPSSPSPGGTWGPPAPSPLGLCLCCSHPRVPFPTAGCGPTTAHGSVQMSPHPGACSVLPNWNQSLPPGKLPPQHSASQHFLSGSRVLCMFCLCLPVHPGGEFLFMFMSSQARGPGLEICETSHLLKDVSLLAPQPLDPGTLYGGPTVGTFPEPLASSNLSPSIRQDGLLFHLYRPFCPVLMKPFLSAPVPPDHSALRKFKAPLCAPPWPRVHPACPVAVAQGVVAKSSDWLCDLRQFT